MDRIRLLVPGNIHHHSGGNIYNARLVQGLKALGAGVEMVAVDGSWPEASAKDRRRLGSLLGAWDQVAQVESDNAVTLVDGLIAMGAPDEMEFAAKAGRTTCVLVHMPAPARHAGAKASTLVQVQAGLGCVHGGQRAVGGRQHG